jgi:hypothetical protein
MCTVSIVAYADGLRMISNRDERLDRPIACEPRVVSLGPRLAAMPTDPSGGGSWIGVNDGGLVAAVLNRYPAVRREADERCTTRGALVPMALGCHSIDEALRSLRGVDASQFQPFRLVLAQRREIALVVGDGCELRCATSKLDEPYMFTASSLGDFVVDGPRRRLFDWLMVDPSASVSGQSLFHRHQWTDKRDISVMMERGDAATVSRTTVDVSLTAIRLEYEPLVPLGPSRRYELPTC